MPARPPTLLPRDKSLLQRLRPFSLKSNNYNNLGKLLSLKRAIPAAGREGVLTQFWHRKKRRRAISGQPSFNVTIGRAPRVHGRRMCRLSSGSIATSFLRTPPHPPQLLRKDGSARPAKLPPPKKKTTAKKGEHECPHERGRRLVIFMPSSLVRFPCIHYARATNPEPVVFI
jgi:hypothetical protein